MSRFLSPLRYPGGKNKLVGFMKLVIERNNLMGGHFVEPYAGGASVSLGLLFEGYVSKIHINDTSKSIFAFWYSVLNETEGLSRLIKDTPVNMESWNRQKSIQANADDYSYLELGFSTFFLNRTNRSGILGGGVIGGNDQGGKWKIDARYNKRELLKRINNIAEQRAHIRLYRQDAVDFVRNTIPELPNRALTYLDPPYYTKGRQLYEDYYCHDDHLRIANVLRQQKIRWIVSYDKTPKIQDMYKGFRRRYYTLRYSAGTKYKGAEVIFFCDPLTIPDLKNALAA